MGKSANVRSFPDRHHAQQVTGYFRTQYRNLKANDQSFKLANLQLWEFIFNDLMQTGIVLFQGYVFSIRINSMNLHTGADCFSAKSQIGRGAAWLSTSFILSPYMTGRFYTYTLKKEGKPVPFIDVPVALADDFILVKTGKLISVETVRGILTPAEIRQGYTMEDYYTVGDSVAYEINGTFRHGTITSIEPQEIQVADTRATFMGRFRIQSWDPNKITDIRKA